MKIDRTMANSAASGECHRCPSPASQQRSKDAHSGSHATDKTIACHGVQLICGPENPAAVVATAGGSAHRLQQLDHRLDVSYLRDVLQPDFSGDGKAGGKHRQCRILASTRANFSLQRDLAGYSKDTQRTAPEINKGTSAAPFCFHDSLQPRSIAMNTGLPKPVLQSHFGDRLTL